MFLIDAHLIDALPADWTRPSPKKRVELQTIPITGPCLIDKYEVVVRAYLAQFGAPSGPPTSYVTSHQ